MKYTPSKYEIEEQAMNNLRPIHEGLFEFFSALMKSAKQEISGILESRKENKE